MAQIGYDRSDKSTCIPLFSDRFQVSFICGNKSPKKRTFWNKIPKRHLLFDFHSKIRQNLNPVTKKYAQTWCSCHQDHQWSPKFSLGFIKLYNHSTICPRMLFRWGVIGCHWHPFFNYSEIYSYSSLSILVNDVFHCASSYIQCKVL